MITRFQTPMEAILELLRFHNFLEFVEGAHWDWGGWQGDELASLSTTRHN